MKKLITILVFFAAIALQAQPVDTIVADLNESNQVAQVISTDSTTGFERYVKVTNAFWNFSQDQFKIYFQVYYYQGQTQIFNKRVTTTVSNTQKVYPDGTDAAPTDSISTPTGNVSKMDSLGHSGEYAFLFDVLESGNVDIMNLIRQKIKELDAEGKFDKN